MTLRGRVQEGAERSIEDERSRNFLLAQVVEESGEGIVLFAEDGRISYANAAAMRLSGLTASALVGQDVGEFASRAGVDREWVLGAAFRDGRWEGPVTFRRRDGAALNTNVSIYCLQDATGARCAAASIRDVSRERTVEAQLRQAQKMEAVGRLAGGVAHDFNNLLAVILSCTRFLEEELPPGDPHREEVREIGAAATRAATLTRQLLVFSRQRPEATEELDPGEIVRQLDRMLRRLLGEDVELVLRTAPEPWPVLADAGQLEQVIVNFAVNARDAMPNGGRIVIASANVHVEEDERPDLPGGDWISLSIEDNGRGMSPEVLAHLFEPFFTTKEVGKGTGLGLSTVYGIVRGLGGRIRVESEEGKGSNFTVFLPRARGDGRAPPAAEPDGGAGGR